MTQECHPRHVAGAHHIGCNATLLIAAHVLGDIDRWWTQHGRNLNDGPDLGDVYKLLHQVAVEAEAAWSLLPDRGDGTRIFSIRAALLSISLLLVEQMVT